MPAGLEKAPTRLGDSERIDVEFGSQSAPFSTFVCVSLCICCLPICTSISSSILIPSLFPLPLSKLTAVDIDETPKRRLITLCMVLSLGGANLKRTELRRQAGFRETNDDRNKSILWISAIANHQVFIPLQFGTKLSWDCLHRRNRFHDCCANRGLDDSEVLGMLLVENRTHYASDSAMTNDAVERNNNAEFNLMKLSVSGVRVFSRGPSTQRLIVVSLSTTAAELCS